MLGQGWYTLEAESVRSARVRSLVFVRSKAGCRVPAVHDGAVFADIVSF
jgi:hypothetical protein